MSTRRSTLRNLVVAIVLAVIVNLIPVVSALADSTGGTFYPR
jgi:hypothetical protein